MHFIISVFILDFILSDIIFGWNKRERAAATQFIDFKELTFLRLLDNLNKEEQISNIRNIPWA